jgi:deoxyribodipyrimidine photo-lyase
MIMIPFSFEPTRAAGLERLAAFAPRTARDYAAYRNTDEGQGLRSNVSMLSPYIRFRMIIEEDVLAAVLNRYTWTSAEKFIQEVFWRAYFKGYLETRPTIWHQYLADVASQQKQRSLPDYQRAVAGQTGIACFDQWVQELIDTGYLHNHARMWFASIWIFTLKLPWVLGADFMYRHLIDGDPASNTLSWRWVGGLHTKGKTYLARPDNIFKYTNERFQPEGLATVAEALEEPLTHNATPLPQASGHWPEGAYGLLITTEDLYFEQPQNQPASIAIPLSPVAKPGGDEGRASAAFRTAALNDANQRFPYAERIASVSPEAVLRWCQNASITTVATAYAAVGPEADALSKIEKHLNQNGIALMRVRRRYDSLCWPHASKGFFALKEKIPSLLEKLNLKSSQGQLFSDA